MIRTGAGLEPGARFRPWHQLMATAGALGELNALLEPLRPRQGAVLHRFTRPAPHPRSEAAAARRHARGVIPRMAWRAVPAADGRADRVLPPLGRRLIEDLRKPVNIAFLVLLTAVLTAWWVELRPTTFLGGPASFITVKGTSMLPTLKTGDFVLAEAQPAYQVGAVVVYSVPDSQKVGAGAVLIHRIVAGNATVGFTLKGDNNQAPDPWTVPRSDVLGKEVLVIPGFGSTLLVLRSPLFAGLVAALIAIWVVLSPPEWLRRRKPAAATETTPSAGAAPLDPPAPATATSPAGRRPHTPTKPAEPAAQVARRATGTHPARRTPAPRPKP